MIDICGARASERLLSPYRTRSLAHVRTAYKQTKHAGMGMVVVVVGGGGSIALSFIGMTLPQILYSLQFVTNSFLLPSYPWQSPFCRVARIVVDGAPLCVTVAETVPVESCFKTE